MTVLLYPNKYRDPELSWTRRIIRILQDAGISLCLPEALSLDGSLGLPVCRKGEHPDFVLALGGDGTMLGAAPYAVEAGVPLAGINLGNVGYLAALEKDEAENLPRLLSPEAHITRRMLLSWQILRKDTVIARGEAVNEIVVKNARPSTVLHLAAESGGRRLYSFRGDGIIAATPTGTTAYTLSAGGPVVDPQARAVIVTPICAHSLVARSVVLAPEGGARIELLSSGQGAGILAADGRDSIALQPGDIVECRESRRDLLLASLKEIPFFDIMRNKLSGEAGESL